MDNRYDVYGIGNAIVDTEVLVEDSVLATHGLEKGVMMLVSEDVQGALLVDLAGYAQHGAAGGSAANTVVGLAQFGGKAFFTGKVGRDMQGTLYRESMAEVGVEFDVDAANEAPTGSCLVLVTPDGERTMQTNLGASADLVAEDVDVERIGQSQLIYVEGRVAFRWRRGRAVHGGGEESGRPNIADPIGPRHGRAFYRRFQEGDQGVRGHSLL